VLTLAAAGAAVWALRTQREADELRRKAETNAASAIRGSRLAKSNERLAKASAAQAQLSTADAKAQREIANQQREIAQTALSRSAVQDAGELAERDRVAEAMAHLARALRIPSDSVGDRSWFTDLVLRKAWWSPPGATPTPRWRSLGGVQSERAACGNGIPGRDGTGVGGPYRQAR
jgi:hypothetical protein